VSIVYRTPEGGEERGALVRFGKNSGELVHAASGRAWKVPEIPGSFHASVLEHLEPATTYYFTVGKNPSKESWFRTPADAGTIRLATGGDMGHDEPLEAYDAVLDAFDPDAILLGGDLAYANGHRGNAGRWIDWLDRMRRVSETRDGRIVPLIVAIGNHETNGDHRPEISAPFFFPLFPQTPGNTAFFSRRFGSGPAVFVLDSDHTADSGGEQARWLAERFRANADAPAILALYHIPLYPSVRKFDSSRSARVRKHWEPLFRKGRLSLGLENHDHALKRTKPIGGVVYIGDGCWGVDPRTTSARDYLAAASPRRHIWLLEAGKSGVTGRAVSPDGSVLDRVSVGPR
jgi:3',5'-cyclic AMP phosphodiesterase CpdA